MQKLNESFKKFDLDYYLNWLNERDAIDTTFKTFETFDEEFIIDIND